MPSIFNSIEKTITTAGAAEALGDSDLKFNIGYVYPLDDNTGNVYLIPADGDGRITILPGMLPPVEIKNPNQTVFNGTQFNIDADVSGEGVRLLYFKCDWKTFHSIEMKLESAMAKYIKTLASVIDDEYSITTGLSDEGRGINSIHTLCDEAEEFEQDSGLWKCTAAIFIETGADIESALLKHRTVTAYVRDLFMDGDNTRQILSSLEPNFSVNENGIMNRKVNTGVDTQRRKFTSQMSFEVLCCGNEVY